jgi:hypothetical protein
MHKFNPHRLLEIIMVDKQSTAPSDEEFAGMVFEEGGDLVVNLSNVEEMKFENVPKGTYSAEIDECTYGMSQSSQQPMLTVKWKINEGEYAGRTLMQFLSFSQKALPGTKTNIARIDAALATQPWKPQELANNGYFLGKTAKIRVDLGEYNGEKRSQIKGLISSQTESGDGFLGNAAA